MNESLQQESFNKEASFEDAETITETCKVDDEPEFIEKKNVIKRFFSWATKDKGRIASLLFLLLFIILIIVLASVNTNFGKIMQDIVDWFQDKIGMWGIYIGVFLISIFGNFTVIFPIPYTLALITIATRPDVNALEILILGLFAGGGAAIGETSAWLLGKASKRVIEDGMEKQVARARSWIDKGLAPLIIFIFAATPLPDDAILIFIGLLGYSLWKTLIWCFLGKIVLTSATGFAAKYLSDTVFGGKILWLFGLTIENGDVTTSEPEPWLSALVWIGTIVLIGVFLFVDWSGVWNRFSRSLHKRKLAQLIVNDKEKLASINFEKTKNNSDKEFRKKYRLSREASLWQCAISKGDEKAINYYDLYTLSFILGKSKDIYLKEDWFNELLKLLNCPEQELEITTIEKLILPTKIKGSFNTPEKLHDFTKNIIFVSFKAKEENTMKYYSLKYLLEKMSDTTIKVRCFGAKDALTIKQIRNTYSEPIVRRLVDFLEELPFKYENYIDVSVGINICNSIENKNNIG